MPVILIRHGRVDKSGGTPLPLSSQGTAIAGGLAGALSGTNVTKVMSPSDPHCMETLEPFANTINVGITNYSSAAEVANELRQGDYTASDLLVLFRMGNRSSIFNALGVGGHAPGSSDDAYGNIWFVNTENSTVTTEPTGF